MSLDRPWALALLAVPVVLLWLRLRAARPREAEASSLLVWAKVSPSDTLPAKPRPPLAAWIEAAGAALIVLGLAGPTGSAPAVAPPEVVIDWTPSMGVHRSDGNELRGGALSDFAGLAAGGTRFGYIEKGLHFPREVPARLTAGKRLVLVSDHRVPEFPDDPPRLRTVGVGSHCFNAGITAASGIPLPDGRWRLFLTVEAFGAPGPVEGTLTLGSNASKVTVQPGHPLEVVREVAVGTSEARIGFKGDALEEDDAVSLKPAGGRTVTCFPNDTGLVPLLKALEAAGAIVPWARVGGGGSQPPFQLGVSSEVREVLIQFTGDLQGPIVKGADVVATEHVLANGVHVDPSSTLGARTGTPTPGTPVLADRDGPLVTTREEGPNRTWASFGFKPGGTWVERDPSFVVFAKNLVEYAAGGPVRIEATGVLDPKETREAAEGETFGDIAEALREASGPDPSSRSSWAIPLLLAGALLLAAAWFARSY